MKITNRLKLPQVLVNSVEKQIHVTKGNISVTSLIDSPRIFQLKKRHDKDIEVDVIDRMWSLYGTAFHKILEEGAEDHALTEEILTASIGGWQVSGQADWFDGVTLCDYKTTSAWSLVYGSRTEDWERQLHAYAHLYRANGFSPEKLQIVAILRDWQKSGVLKSKDYPKDKVVVTDIPMWDPHEALDLFEQFVERHRTAEAQKDDDLPECTREEKWQKDDTWALMKEGNKTAIKVCHTEEEAEDLLKKAYRKSTHIQHRPGGCIRCEEYCEVNKFCKYYKEG